MALETTSTITATLGSGTKTAAVVHSTGAPRSALPEFALSYDVEKGYAIFGVTKLGARIAASAYAEAGAANANTALPTPTQSTLTPASYVATMAPTTEAFNRTDPNLVSLGDLLMDEIVYPLETLLAYDSTIGCVTALPLLASNRVGTSGATLTPSTIFNAAKQLWTQIAQTNVDVFCWLDVKGWNDLVIYGVTTAGQIFGTPIGYNQMFADLLSAQGYDTGSYLTSWGHIHLFLEPKPGSLGTSGVDSIAPMFIPWVGGLNGLALPGNVRGNFAALQRGLPGGVPLSPAYAIGYRSEPASAAMMIGAMGGPFEKRIVAPSGAVIDVMARGRAGQNLAILDGFVSIVAIELNDNSHVGVRYST